MTDLHPTADPAPAMADPFRDIAEHVGCALISLRLFQREKRPEMIESAIENLELASAQLSEASDD